MNKLISLIIFIFALVYLAYNTDLDDLFLYLSQYSYISILYIISITIISFILVSLRWQQLTSSNLSFYDSFKTNLASSSDNFTASKFLSCR